MFIIHISTHYYPVLGGLERVVQRVAEEQAKLGHEIHIITSYNGAQGRPREETLNDVHVHRVKTWRLIYPDLTLPREIPRKILKQADIVHIHSHNSFFNIWIAKEAKRYGANIVVHFMAVDALLSHSNFLKCVLGFQYQKVLTRKALRLADLKLTKSSRDQQILKERYGVDTVYVPDGIDEEYLRKPRDPVKFRRIFNIKEDEEIFLYIGRLHPAKGPQILVKAVPYLRKNIERFKVVLVGPGSKEWLVKLARKLGAEQHVILTGSITEDLKISAIDTSTCVVIPSLYDYVEVFSLVASEAWARGKPVVASAIGELPYRIKHGENGLLVPPNDPETLARALADIIRYEFKFDKYLITWRQVAVRLCSLYRKTPTIKKLSQASKEVLLEEKDRMSSILIRLGKLC